MLAELKLLTPKSMDKFNQNDLSKAISEAGIEEFPNPTTADTDQPSAISTPGTSTSTMTAGDPPPRKDDMKEARRNRDRQDKVDELDDLKDELRQLRKIDEEQKEELRKIQEQLKEIAENNKTTVAMIRKLEKKMKKLETKLGNN